MMAVMTKVMMVQRFSAFSGMVSHPKSKILFPFSKWDSSHMTAVRILLPNNNNNTLRSQKQLKQLNTHNFINHNCILKIILP